MVWQLVGTGFAKKKKKSVREDSDGLLLLWTADSKQRHNTAVTQSVDVCRPQFDCWGPTGLCRHFPTSTAVRHFAPGVEDFAFVDLYWNCLSPINAQIVQNALFFVAGASKLLFCFTLLFSPCFKNMFFKFQWNKKSILLLYYIAYMLLADGLIFNGAARAAYAFVCEKDLRK